MADIFLWAIDRQDIGLIFLPTGIDPGGSYPHGRSPCGANDMVENVLERSAD